MTELIDRESKRIGVLGHGSPMAAIPSPSAVALKTIEIYQRRDIVGHVRHVAPAVPEAHRCIGRSSAGGRGAGAWA